VSARFSTGFTIALGLALGLVAGCASDSDVLTYDQFKAQAYQEPESGAYVLNGDELIDTDEGMQAAYDSYLMSVAFAEDRADGLSTVDQPLIVNRVNGQDDRWNAATANNLTYCVDTAFGSRYTTVVNAMEAAGAAWHATANVTFVHVASEDGNCDARNKNVVFDVRQVNTTQYLARSFFPSTTRRTRNVLISTSSFGNISPWTLTGILRHELGHTIGFRHEHTRPEAGTCFEDNNWRALTAYDSASVMHYPQCNGTQNGDLVLTSLDKTGARALYP
jgi:hypothetical protein